MREHKERPTLDQPVTYEITVPGHLDEHWTEWDGRLTVTLSYDADSRPITRLTRALDQAGLQGLLRRLYALGLPLIAVRVVDSPADRHGEPT